LVIRTNNTYKETVAVISGGVTGLFRVKDRSAIRLILATGNIAQNRTLDGSFNTSNDGISYNPYFQLVMFTISVRMQK
jgi:hypothetical protein